jgi:hypothetical protein
MFEFLQKLPISDSLVSKVLNMNNEGFLLKSVNFAKYSSVLVLGIKKMTMTNNCQ